MQDIAALVGCNTGRTIENCITLFARQHPSFFARPHVHVEDLIVEAFPDVDLDTRLNLALGAKTHAVVCRVQRSTQFEILIDEGTFDRDFEEANRCLAEEVAHLLLHKPLLYQVNTEEDFLELQRSDHWVDYEGQAKQGALMLRLPTELVLNYLPKLYADTVSLVGFRDATSFHNNFCRAGAILFYVSVDEFSQRLSELPCNIPNQLVRNFLNQELTLSINGLSSVVPVYRQQRLFD